jgi:hypothetical protein
MKVNCTAEKEGVVQSFQTNEKALTSIIVHLRVHILRPSVVFER